MKLQDYTIHEYAEMLKNKTDVKIVGEIDKELNAQLNGVGTGQNIGLFLLQKDLLLLQCKRMIAVYEFDKAKELSLTKRIDKLREEIESKQKKVEVIDPYAGFLDWILSVEKYLSVPIDRENDLLYLARATKQMLSFYESQKKQLEEQKVKTKR